MADFNYYINRQGPKGAQGDKGETGFSPSIIVDTNTAAEYKLRIVNEDGSFVTDNLRGSAVDDQGGTYMRYDSETGMMFAGNPNYATDAQYGEVIIATDADIENGAEDKVATADRIFDLQEEINGQASTLVSLQTQINDIDIPDVSTLATKTELSTEATNRTQADNALSTRIDNIVIPTVNNGTLTISQGSNTLGTFSANQSTDVTVNIPEAGLPNNGTLTIVQDGVTLGTFSADQATNTTISFTTPQTIDITTTLTSSSTNAEVPGAKTVYDSITGVSTTLTSEISSLDGRLDLVEDYYVSKQTDVTTTVTSGSTDAQVPTAKAVFDALPDVSSFVTASDVSTQITQATSTFVTETTMSTAISSATSTMVTSDTIREIVSLTEAEYETITTPQSNVEYLITDATASDTANINLSNITTNAEIKITNLAMPGTTSVSLTPGATGTSYTAPTNGYFFAYGNGANAGDMIGFNFSGNCSDWKYSTGGAGLNLFTPCAKGNSVVLVYSAGVTGLTLSFIPCIGSESEVA